jgi:hypothetical protein
MKPFYRGPVNVSLVTKNPDNRILLDARIEKLEKSMLNFVMDSQNPIILSTEVSSNIQTQSEIRQSSLCVASRKSTGPDRKGKFK